MYPVCIIIVISFLVVNLFVAVIIFGFSQIRALESRRFEILDQIKGRSTNDKERSLFTDEASGEDSSNAGLSAYTHNPNRSCASVTVTVTVTITATLVLVNYH